MSAIAIVLAEMGHTVSGSDIREQPVLDRLRAAGIAIHVGHQRQPTSRVVTPSPPRRRYQRATSSCATPPNSAFRHCAEPACWRRSAPAPAPWLSPARMARRRPSSMLMLALAEGGLTPSFLIGGDVADAGTGAQWTGSDLLVVEADESDGTHVELPLYATMLTNIEVDHLDHHGSFDAIVASFDRYLGQVDGPEGAVRRRPALRGTGRRALGDDVWARPPAPSIERSRCTRRRGRSASRSNITGPCSGRSNSRYAGLHNVANAVGVVAMATELGRAVRVSRHGAQPFRWRRSSIRHSRRRRRCDVRRRLRPPADGDRRGHRRGEGQRRQLEAGDRRLPAEPLQPHVGDVPRLCAMRSSTPMSSCSRRSMRRARRPIPGVTGHLVVDAVLRGTSRFTRRVAAASRGHHLVSRRRSRRGRRLHFDGLWRHRHAARRGDGPAIGAESRNDDGTPRRAHRGCRRGARRSRRARRCAGAIHDVPPRWTGDVVRTCTVDRRPRRRRGSTSRVRTACACRRARVESARRRRRLSGHRRLGDRARWRSRAPERGRAAAEGPERRAGLALPVVARRLAAAGLRGFEWAVGVPGSFGGAVRMNAGGHGSDMASCLVAAHVFDLASGTAAWRPVDDLGLRFRSSNLTSLDVVVAVTLAVHCRRPRRRRGGDRRDRQVASGEPARWSERRLGVRQPGSGRGQRGAADRRARPSRAAPRNGVGVGEARQLHPDHGGRLGRRRAGGHRTRSGAGCRCHRFRAAQRGPPRRIRGRAHERAPRRARRARRRRGSG